MLLACLSLVLGFSIFFSHTGFLRNYVGDVVAVTFLYSIVQLTLRPKPIIAAAGVLAVAIIVEVLQAFVTLPHSPVTTLALGSTFDPLDLLTYFLTVTALYSLEIGSRSAASAFGS